MNTYQVEYRNEEKALDNEDKNIKENVFLPIQVEKYINVNIFIFNKIIFKQIQSSSEWENINEIIRVTIKSLTDTVHYQGMALKWIEQ